MVVKRVAQSVKDASPQYQQSKITPVGHYTEDRYPDTAYAKQFIANKDIPDSYIKKGDRFAIIDRSNIGGGYKALREKLVQDPQSGLFIREHSYVTPESFTHESQVIN